MVSRRGVKIKFFVGERVLCYEPDPTKAKVLYDSKVLDIVLCKDSNNKKLIEYLIHFQGWNSSWDRRVREAFVLKDTPENRQLQKDLAEKAQLQLGAYLYRKERKKHNKPLERNTISSEDGSSGSPARIDTDENIEMSSSSDENSSLEDEVIEIEIVQELREILEADYYLINGKNKRLKLPAEPNVVTILESYYRHYATNQFCGLNEKPSSRYRNHFNNRENRPKTEDIQRNVALCREVCDGLRTYFDYTVNDLLLYGSEKGPGQFVTAPALMKHPDSPEAKAERTIVNNVEPHSTIVPNNNHVNNHNGFSHSSLTNSRRRTLRSNNKVDAPLNGNGTIEETNGATDPKPGSSIGSSNSDINGPITKALSWRLLPDYIYNQQPPPPCLVYGAIHFARLFVKMPELLTQSSIPDNKMKVILQHVDGVIDFLNEHKEWYGEKFYVDAPSLCV
ncbi:male-specific lethal 3 homolog isoform X2 [Anthonomus grandis grandis]|uniref:male-specific lethal 3 homolog isoform X2 n=1 Tax=Anthonomus grandis grandis TaxID=2921223 RepID=UPI0021668239|nr:male-specific lethal 3 homolog isoform X2 [Anthonomus grandis grandis]